MSLLGDVASLNKLQTLGASSVEDKDEGKPKVVRATKGKKLTQAGRSTSDGMLDLLKRGKTKDDDSTTNKKSKPKKPEFHIPTSNHGKSKHFGIREEHITELAEEKKET